MAVGEPLGNVPEVGKRRHHHSSRAHESLDTPRLSLTGDLGFDPCFLQRIAGPNTPMVAGLSLCDKVGARLQVHNCKLQSTSSPRSGIGGPGWAARGALETAGNEGRLASVAVVYAHSA